MFQSTILHLLFGLLLLGLPAQAQQPPPDLVVQLHAVDGAPIAGVAIIIRDQAGSHELARALTNSVGRAELRGITLDRIRVAVQGHLADGTPLYQPGDDAHGILVLLFDGTLQLDLRSELDGMVVPDPSTMTANELGAPLATAFPSAVLAPSPAPPLAPSASLPTWGPASGLALMEQQTPATFSSSWTGLIVLALLLGLGAFVLLFQRRWRSL